MSSFFLYGFNIVSVGLDSQDILVDINADFIFRHARDIYKPWLDITQQVQ